MTDPREVLIELMARASAAAEYYDQWDQLRESTRELFRCDARIILDVLCAAPPELLWPILMPWRPMETAPRDGTAVLVNSDSGIQIAFRDPLGEWLIHATEAWPLEPIGWLPLPPPGVAP